MEFRFVSNILRYIYVTLTISPKGSLTLFLLFPRFRSFWCEKLKRNILTKKNNLAILRGRNQHNDAVNVVYIHYEKEAREKIYMTHRRS
jgi:thioredoxin-related protein